MTQCNDMDMNHKDPINDILDYAYGHMEQAQTDTIADTYDVTQLDIPLESFNKTDMNFAMLQKLTGIAVRSDDNGKINIPTIDGNTNPIGWLNELMQNLNLCRKLKLEQKLIWNYVDDYSKGKYFTIHLSVIVDDRVKVFESKASARKIGERNVAKVCVHYIKSLIALNEVTANGQMEDETVQGEDTAQGEKQINTILTRDVPSVMSGIRQTVDFKMPLLRAVATAEEEATFPVLQSRWIQIGDGNFNITDRIRLVKADYALPEAVYNVPGAPNRLPFDQFMFCRPNMQIKVKINSHKFAQGRYYLHYFYDADATGYQANTGNAPVLANILGTQNAFVLRDHVIMDLGVSNEATINIPFRAITPFIPSLRSAEYTTNSARYAHVYISTLAPLRVGDGSSTTVPFTVWARFEDSTFTGMRWFKDPLQPTTTADGQMGLNTSRDIISTFRNLPVIGGLVGGATSALSHAALAIQRPFRSEQEMRECEERFKYVGLIKNRDKPIDIRQPMEFRPNYAGNLGVGVLPEPAISLRLDPTCTTVQLPEHCIGNEFESIYDMIRLYGFASSLEWQQSQTAGTLLGTLASGPWVNTNPVWNTDTLGTWPNIDFFAQFYGFYSGSIEYRFDIIGTAFHTGILMVAYVPYNQSYTFDQAKSGYYKIFDLREQRSFDFIVPYISNSVVRHTVSYNWGNGLRPIIPGAVTVWIVNPLNPIQSVSTSVQIMVYKRAGLDFRFTGIKGSYGIPDVAPNSGAIAYPVVVEEEEQPIVERTLRQRNTTPIIDHHFADCVWADPNATEGPDTCRCAFESLRDLRTRRADGQMEFEDHDRKEDIDRTPEFGTVPAVGCSIQLMEDQMKIKDIIRRWVLALVLNLGNSATITPATAVEYLIPVCPPHYYTRVKRTLMNAILTQYRWSRGSIKYMFDFSGMAGNISKVEIRHVMQSGEAMTTRTALTDPGNSAIKRGGVAWTVVYPSLQPLVKLEVPFNSRYNYYDNQCAMAGGASVGDISKMAANGGRLQLLFYGTTASINLPAAATTFEMYVSCGDDYELIQYSPYGRANINYRGVITEPAIQGDQVTDTERTTTKDDEEYRTETLLDTARLEQVAKLAEVAGDGQMDSEEQYHDVITTLPPEDEGELNDPEMEKYTTKTSYVLDFPRRVWHRSSTAISDISKTTRNAYEVIQEMPKIKTSLENTMKKVDDGLSYIVQVAQSITDKVLESCTWLRTGSVIFSAILHFLQCVINPCYQSFAIAVCGVLTAIGGFFAGLAKSVLSWMLDPARAPRDQQAGDTADGQCEHECKNCPQECNESCNFCVDRLMFNSSDLSALCGLVMAAVSAYFGYKSEAKSNMLWKGLFLMNRNFWTTISQSGRFLVDIIRLVKRCVMKLTTGRPEFAEARALTVDNIHLQAFIAEAQMMTDQRNLQAMATDVRIKNRFWTCVAAAYQYQMRFTMKATPVSPAILRICQRVITIAEKESIHAMACPVRYEPFVLCLEGNTKIGKSFMIQDIVPDLLADPEVYGLQSYDNPLFVRTPGVEFWNGYKNHPVVLYDDFLANMSPELASRQVTELYNLKSSAVMNMNMASLEDKDMRGNPLMVILCCNNGFVVMNGTTTPEAFLRRSDSKWNVRLDPKYRTVEEVPNEVKAKFHHLQFGKYTDPANQQSLSENWLEFDQWYAALKQEAKAYHIKEQIHVRRRMERLTVLLPETARDMMHEIDPFKVFYAAYTGAAEDPTLIQTGYLPSEVVEMQLEMMARAGLTAINEDNEIFTEETLQPNADPQADGQIGLRGLTTGWNYDGIRQFIKDMWYVKPTRSANEWWIVENNPIEECAVCGEEVEMTVICENGHRLCHACYSRILETASRDELNDGCPQCRARMVSTEVSPENFALQIAPFYYAKRYGKICKDQLKCIYRKLATKRNVAALIYGMAVVAYASLSTSIIAHSVVGERRKLNCFLQAFNRPTLPEMTVQRYGIFYWSSEKADGQMDSDEDSALSENSYLAGPSQQVLRPVMRRNVTVVSNMKCPHKLMKNCDYMDFECKKDIAGRVCWSYMAVGDVVEVLMPDGPCHFADCYWKDDDTRYMFYKNWAQEWETCINRKRAAYNLGALGWELPPEFLSKEAEDNLRKRESAIMKEIRAFAGYSTWDILCGRVSAVKEWIGKMASQPLQTTMDLYLQYKRHIDTIISIVGGLATFVAGYNMIKGMFVKKQDGQFTNSGAFHNLKVPRKHNLPRKANLRNRDGQMGAMGEVAIRLVKNNTFFLHVSYKEYVKGNGATKTMRVRGLGLYGRTACIPKHTAKYLIWLMRRNQKEEDMNLKIMLRRVTIDHEVEFPQDMRIFLFGTTEFAYFETPHSVAMFKDISNFVTTQENHANLSPAYQHVETDEDGSVMIRNEKLTGLLDKLKLNGTCGYDPYYVFDIYMSTYGRVGACGSVYITDSQSPIFAMHVAGDNQDALNRTGYGAALIREDILALQEGKMELSYFIPKDIGGCDGQTSLPGAINPIGYVDAKQTPFMPMKSKIIPSLLQNRLMDKDEKITIHTQPGILSNKDPRFVWNGTPLYWGCIKHTEPVKDFPTKELKEVQSWMTAELNYVCTPLRNIRQRLDYETAIIGYKEIVHYDTIDLTTSSGWPWNCGARKTKDKWIEVERGEDGFPIRATIDPELVSVMNLKTEQRRRGIRPFTVFLDWLKDERRKATKLRKPDGTRIFSLSPVDFTIQLRQRTLDFSASFMKHRDELEHAVGICTDGPEWSRMANWLLANSNNFVTGDYSDFGPKLTAGVVRSVGSVIADWYKHNEALTGLEERELSVMFEELAHSYHLMGNFIYEVMCGSPSGASLTVIINSMANIMYIRIQWLLIMNGTMWNDMKHFTDHVRLKCYGDDMIMTVSDQVIEKFNCETLCKAFARFGIVFTNAQKNEITTLETIDTATFLKCGFKKHPTRENHWLAPLEELSIRECAQWIWKTNDVEAATALNAEQSLLLAYGHGPDYYNYWKNIINKGLREIGLKELSTTWDHLDVTHFGLNTNVTGEYSKALLPSSFLVFSRNQQKPKFVEESVLKLMLEERDET